MKPSSKASPTDSIEASLERLEAIVADIESNPPPLETLIARYEEGARLLKTSQEKLAAAEKKIELITRSIEGEAVLEPFQQG